MITHKKDFSIVRMLLLCLGLFVFPALSSTPARATQEPPRAEMSMKAFDQTEKVGFAFYSLTKLEPPFSDWIDLDPEYMDAQPKVRLYMKPAKLQRLQAGYQSFSHARDFLTVRLGVTIRLLEENPKADVPAAELGQTKAIEINFGGNDEMLYFPYQVGKIWVALVPGEMQRVTTYGITPAQYQKLLSTFGPNVRKGQSVTLELRMLTSRADSKNPLVVGDMPLFLLMSDLGAVNVLDDRKKPVWSYYAGWYDSDGRNELLNLHDGP